MRGEKEQNGFRGKQKKRKEQGKEIRWTVIPTWILFLFYLSNSVHLSPYFLSCIFFFLSSIIGPFVDNCSRWN
jgi:hypothetical protein